MARKPCSICALTYSWQDWLLYRQIVVSDFSANASRRATHSAPAAPSPKITAPAKFLTCWAPLPLCDNGMGTNAKATTNGDLFMVSLVAGAGYGEAPTLDIAA
jgi:hypothetical protein